MCQIVEAGKSFGTVVASVAESGIVSLNIQEFNGASNMSMSAENHPSGVSPSLLAVVAVSAPQQPSAWRRTVSRSPWLITIRRWPKQLQSGSYRQAEPRFPLTLDVTDSAQVAASVAAAEAALGPVDYLVNAAGIFQWANAEDISDTDFETMFRCTC